MKWTNFDETDPPMDREVIAYFDILPFLKKGDSYDVAQVLCNRFGRYFRPARNYPNLSPDTHVGSIACGNLLYEIAISSRIDMLPW